MDVKHLVKPLACSAGVFSGRNLVRVRIVVAAIFDSMTVQDVEDWGE